MKKWTLLSGRHRPLVTLASAACLWAPGAGAVELAGQLNAYDTAGTVPEAAPVGAVGPTQVNPNPAVAAAKPAELPTKLTAGPGKGVTFDAGDVFSLTVRSRVQLRYQLDSTKAPGDERQELQTVTPSTLRLWLSGHAYTRDLDYMIQLALAARDYRDGAISPIFDAYLDYKPHRDFNLRVGQFFVPFDRLRTVREWALQLAERPRPVAELTLDRDVGISLYSDRFGGDDSPVAWRVGVFGGGGTNLTTGKSPGALFVGRLELRPFGPIDDDVEGDGQHRQTPGLALGAALAENVDTNRVRSTTGRTFTGGKTDYFHADVDLVFKWAGAALQAEYLWKNSPKDAVLSMNEDGEILSEPTRSGRGWVLQASYQWQTPFEIVGRWSRLSAFAGTDPALVREIDALGQEVGAGVNYYVSGHRFKLQADWLARLPRDDFEWDYATHAVHAQLDATF